MHRMTQRSALRASLQVKCSYSTLALHTIRSRSFTTSSLILQQSNNQTNSQTATNVRPSSKAARARTSNPHHDTLLTKSIIKSLINDKRYAKAVEIAHEKSLSRGPDPSTFLGWFPGLEKRAIVKHSPTEMALLCEIWDACYAAQIPLDANTMDEFAVAFDRADDAKRIMEVAQLIIKNHKLSYKGLQVYSLMLHLVAAHGSTDDLNSLRNCITQFIAHDPSLSLIALQHQGAISSMLNKEQVDEAARYLREHASSLQIDAVQWNRVLSALRSAKLEEQQISLYQHWMSVLPPIDELKRHQNFKRIVPSIVTYLSLFGQISKHSLSAEHVIAHLNKFEITPSSRLFELIISNASYNNDYKSVVFCWNQMLNREIVSDHVLKILVGFVREHRKNEKNMADADRFATILWDFLHNRRDVTTELGWMITFLEVFDETRDVQRILQVADVIMTSPLRVTAGVLTRNMMVVLSKYNQTDKHAEFDRWRLSIVPNLEMNDSKSVQSEGNISIDSWVSAAGIDEMPKNESVAVMQIVSRLKEANYKVASNMLHQVQNAGSVSDSALNNIARTKELSLTSATTLPFVSQLWDLCYATETPLRMNNLYYFAVSFDRTSDNKRLLELAELIIKTTLKMPSGLSVCALVLYLLSGPSHVDVLAKLKHHIAGSIAVDPFASISTLQHRGAIDSMLNKQQIDEAVAYLREHATSWELETDVWTRVLTALCLTGRVDQAMILFKHWLSVLPPIDQLKEKVNYRHIVPDVVTYSLLWKYCTKDNSISAAYTLAEVAKFDFSPDHVLYEAMIKNSIGKRDYQSVFLCWDHMRNQGIQMNDKLMVRLIRLLRRYGQQHEHLADADCRLAMLWDHRADLAISEDQSLTFLEAFNRTRDVSRILQLVDVIMLQLVDVIMLRSDGIRPGYLARRITKILKENNQEDKLREFSKCILGLRTAIPLTNSDQQVVSHLDQKNFKAATQMLHEMRFSGPVSDTTLTTILSSKVLRKAASRSEDISSFSTHLWDLSYASKIPLSTDNLNHFAVSFDRADDRKRIVELANAMIKTPLQMPRDLQVCSMMLHLVANQTNMEVSTSLRKHITDCIADDPSLSLTMLQHRGAIGSIFDNQKIDQAVEYLREHAAGLELDADVWNRVMSVLYATGQADQAMRLYQHWMSVLPPVGELKQRPNFKRIVPSVVTYNLVLSHPTAENALSAQYVLTRMDELELPSDPIIYEHILKDAVNLTDVLLCWDHMRNRDIQMNTNMMARFVDFIRVSSDQSNHAVDADRLAVMLWDYRADVFIQLRWALRFMQSFDRTGDLVRMLQVVDVITVGRKPVAHEEATLEDIAALLEKHNRTKKLNRFQLWRRHGWFHDPSVQAPVVSNQTQKSHTSTSQSGRQLSDKTSQVKQAPVVRVRASTNFENMFDTELLSDDDDSAQSSKEQQPELQAADKQSA